MIDSKRAYREYLLADKNALRRKRRRPRISDLIWRYEIALRQCEYYENCKKGKLNRIIEYYYKFKRSGIGIACHYSIPLNVCGKGLNIVHIGPIIVHDSARIGEYCRMHVGVHIGTQAGTEDQAPAIGDRVYVGPGAKLFGRIEIADDIAIGANAVVNRSFLEEGITIAGVPARKVSEKGSFGLLYAPSHE